MAPWQNPDGSIRDYAAYNNLPGVKSTIDYSTPKPPTAVDDAKQPLTKKPPERPGDNWAGGGGLSPTTGGAFAAGGGGGGDVGSTALGGLMGAMSRPTEGTGGYSNISGRFGIPTSQTMGQRILPEDDRILAGLQAARGRIY